MLNFLEIRAKKKSPKKLKIAESGHIDPSDEITWWSRHWIDPLNPLNQGTISFGSSPANMANKFWKNNKYKKVTWLVNFHTPFEHQLVMWYLAVS